MTGIPGVGGQSLLGNMLQPMGNIMKGFSGISMMKQGAELQQAGYRNAQIGVNNTLAFNESVVNFNLYRDLADLGREIYTTMSTQRAQAGASGTSGKSALMVMNETMDLFERTTLRLHNNAEIQRKQLQYEAAVRNTELQNQAQYAAWQSSVQQSQAMSGLFSQIGQMFGGF